MSVPRPAPRGPWLRRSEKSFRIRLLSMLERLWIKRRIVAFDSGGGRPVARYHLYYFQDNRLLGDDRIDAADDAAAVRLARAQGRGQVVEVWNANARIGVVAPARTERAG